MSKTLTDSESQAHLFLYSRELRSWIYLTALSSLDEVNCCQLFRLGLKIQERFPTEGPPGDSCVRIAIVLDSVCRLRSNRSVVVGWTMRHGTGRSGTRLDCGSVSPDPRFASGPALHLNSSSLMTLVLRGLALDAVNFHPVRAVNNSTQRSPRAAAQRRPKAGDGISEMTRRCTEHHRYMGVSPRLRTHFPYLPTEPF